MKNNNLTSTPGGMKGYLPEVSRELIEIEKRIIDVFEVWGYQQVITPTIEYYDVLVAGMGKKQNKDLYKFIDYEGNILALRPEMTAPIARTVAARINNINLPVRYSYKASVFRYDQPQAGKNREIFQAGIELIGKNDYISDAEIIIIAIESILKAGIEDFTIDIGHAEFLDGLLKGMELTDEEIYRIKEHLIKKDLVGLNNYINEFSSQIKGIIDKIPLLRGGKEILAQAGELLNSRVTDEALENLALVYDYICDYGLEDYISLDLGLIRGFDYYTGVVFEGFTGELGYTICGGGRYDNLINQYCGEKVPAIGFAIGIERIRLALRKRQTIVYNSRPTVMVIIDDFIKESFALIKALQGKAITVIVGQEEELESLCQERNISKTIKILDSVTVNIEDPISGESKKIDLNRIWEELTWEK